MPKHKPRKIVAAGWYVSAGLVFVLVAIPPEWLDTTSARWLLFVLGVLCLSGAGYEWWFRKPEQPTTSTPARHLDSRDVAAIIRTVHAGLEELDRLILASGSATREELKEKSKLLIVSLGGERETLNYRNALAKAFGDGGFEVFVDVCPAGDPEFERYAGAVTVIEDRDNFVRPFVMDALRAAGIGVLESQYMPHYRPQRHIEHYGRWAARLIVG